MESVRGIVRYMRRRLITMAVDVDVDVEVDSEWPSEAAEETVNVTDGEIETMVMNEAELCLMVSMRLISVDRSQVRNGISLVQMDVLMLIMSENELLVATELAVDEVVLMGELEAVLVANEEVELGE
jgi:hypothetical protein